MMKKLFFIVVLTFLVFVAVACGGNETNDSDSNVENDNAEGNAGSEESVTLIFSTQGLGTSFNTMTNAFTQVFSEQLPDGTKFDIKTTSPGGIAAAYIIDDGSADITIGNTAPANWAVETGIEGRHQVEGVRSLGGGYDAPIALAIFTQDFVDASGYTSLEEIIEDKYPIRIATKAQGSFGEMTARVVLEQLGVTYDDIKSWGGSVTLTDSGNVIDMLRDGRVDITIDHTNLNQPNYIELSMTKDIHFAEFSEELRDTLFNMGYAHMTIPEGSFGGNVESEIKTVGSPTALLVSESVSEDIAYEMTKAIAENKEQLVQGFAAFEVFNPKTACEPANAGAPLHPGAQRYYEENGCLQ